MLTRQQEDDIRDLTWRLVDDVIDDEQQKRLHQYLESDPAARQIYLRCICLHTGLLEHFENGRQRAAKLKEDVFLSELLESATLEELTAPASSPATKHVHGESAPSTQQARARAT